MRKTLAFLGALLALAIPSGLLAQQNGYSQTNLVSNTTGVATTTDTQLVNPWGIAFVPGQDFWIANNNGGTSTLYDGQGNRSTLVVTIPGATNNPSGNCAPGCPTGTVANSTGSYFGGGHFLFDTEDGLIANWTGANDTAAVAFNNAASGAVYKGLALLNGNTLLAANFHSGKIDVVDRNFQLTNLGGSFTDPRLPAGLAPHGVHVINGQVYVAYAMQDGARHDAQPGAGLGQVDIFDANGNFLKTFVAGGRLNAPWGVVAAPAGFGQFPNAILVGNFGDGRINAYDTNGNFLGQVSDPTGHALLNPGLWELTFGGGGASGDAGTLYLTAGGSNQPNFPAGGTTTSVFASVVPASVAGPDFSLNLSALTANVTPGGTTTLNIGSSAVGGFNGQIALSCSTLSGISCAFNPTTISPGSSTASSQLTISAAAVAPPTGYGMAVLLPSLGLFGTIVMGRKRNLLTRKNVLATSALALMLLLALVAVGCGGGGSKQTTGPNQVTLLVKGTSGAVSHSTPVMVTIQ